MHLSHHTAMETTTPSRTPQTTTISPATPSDLPALAHTVMASHMPEAILAFLFKSWPRTEKILPHYTSRVSAKLAEMNSNWYKLTLDHTGEVIGVVCMTYENGREKSLSVIGGEIGDGDGDFDYVFAREALGGLASVDVVMEGREHFMVSSLAVNPDYQRRGYGTKLMLHCHQLARERGLPIYLTSFPGAHDFYLSLGYRDMKHFDVDLNEWGTTKRGFGIYRSYGMVWEPEGNRCEGLC
ncbi:acyl-CoA N-acyltransferase [Cadophora sp. DSE1049]|nr:acyl-CoA N-acyltransferase [Cadophora sp. DSE1049]